MDTAKKTEIAKLVRQRLAIATKFLQDGDFKNEIRKSLNEEAEIPGFEDKPVKFGQFISKEFVAVMTDIRKSTDIINSINGTQKMFLIFYVYSAVVAKIIDSYKGTATEFLGDGVLNLFDTDITKEQALQNAFSASKEILQANEEILNPTFTSLNLPNIKIGIGIDIGNTIVTRFGYRVDNDLKAFGRCVYNVSRLCKGVNEILVSEEAQELWPTSPTGTLRFSQTYIDNNKIAYKTYNV
jgi:class 3 adenylate cyclase